MQDRQRVAQYAADVLSKKKIRPFKLEEFCFKEQLDFIRDPAPYKTGVCSRRAGKTTACAADLTDTALAFDNVVCLYITLKRKNAKRLIWPELLRINRVYALGGEPNIADLSLTFPSGSVIYCSGAKDSSEIEDFRGLALKKVYIDEGQAFRSYIEDLVDDVLSKALYDHNGQLIIIGTPGTIKAGYFYECTKSKEWSHHFWTMFQNPWLEKKSGLSPQALTERDCKRMGVDLQHPRIQRENFGLWVEDPESQVFKYNRTKNHFDVLPKAEEWNYVIAVDLGSNAANRDSDAIAVIGWPKHSRKCYLVEEIELDEPGITPLAAEIESLQKKYKPLKIVVDTGGLGKKITDELNRRFQTPLVAAEKQRKFEYIELLNDALRRGDFMAQEQGLFAQDTKLVEWDLEKRKKGIIAISDQYHSDIGDAVLYGFREAMHWIEEPEVDKPKRGSPEWYKEEEQRMKSALERRVQERRLAREMESGHFGPSLSDILEDL